MVMNAVLPACAVCSSNNYKKTTPKVHKAYQISDTEYIETDTFDVI